MIFYDNNNNNNLDDYYLLLLLYKQLVYNIKYDVLQFFSSWIDSFCLMKGIDINKGK